MDVCGSGAVAGGWAGWTCAVPGRSRAVRITCSNDEIVTSVEY